MHIRYAREWDSIVHQHHGTMVRFGDRPSIRRMMDCVKAEIEEEQRLQALLESNPDTLRERADDVAEDWQWSCRFIRRCEYALAALA